MPTLEEGLEDRYIPNTMPMRSLGASPMAHFQTALETLVREFPPLEELREEHLWGFSGGYIGIAHMFLQLSALHPGITIRGDNLRQWAHRYVKRDRGPVPALPRPMCGLINEDMSYNAVRACLSGMGQDVDRFLQDFDAAGAPVPEGEEDEYDPEMMQGRAGALYLLRLVRHWVPACSSKINAHIDNIATRLLQANNYGEESWRWGNGRYIGAVHGDIGNITQLVLSKPGLAETLETHLKRLLDMQFEDGGWPMFSNREDETETKMVQFCHGAPGFIFSLWALRSHFPNLAEAIDTAIDKAQECVWAKGLIKKEPGLCHGILGNALTLPLGSQRNHFLNFATEKAVEEGKSKGMFEDAHYDWSHSVQMVYKLGAVWAWGVCEMERPPMVMYTDV
ncbi:hypothetical protein PWT90_05577 [Aphanocladium album]|nr:hypothetical protein PWT90_05577 [Aphanocladium album]